MAAEALTNIAKYASTTAWVAAVRTPRALVLTVRDDGAGGAAVRAGTGLAGLKDRLAAFEGTLCIDSPRGEGTYIRAEIPLPPHDGAEAVGSGDAASAEPGRRGAPPRAGKR